ncbi:hypothetical protein JCM10213_005892 [Rhodosporidiobolus nylandii]
MVPPPQPLKLDHSRYTYFLASTSSPIPPSLPQAPSPQLATALIPHESVQTAQLVPLDRPSIPLFPFARLGDRPSLAATLAQHS